MSSRRARPRSPEIRLQGVRRFRDLSSPGLEVWLERVLGDLVPEASSFGVRFVGREGMKALCKRFYPKSRITDVLSFPGSELPDGLHVGDVVVCVPLARQQAAAVGQSLDKEVKTLLLHGLLHCLGYDHETDSGEMEALEAVSRRRWIDRGASK